MMENAPCKLLPKVSSKSILIFCQSVHDSNLENYLKLEKLVAKTVNPYLSTSVLCHPKPKSSNVDCDPMEQHQTKMYMIGNERLDPVIEVDVGSQHSSVSSASNESMTPAMPLLLKAPNTDSDTGYSYSNPN